MSSQHQFLTFFTCVRLQRELIAADEPVAPKITSKFLKRRFDGINSSTTTTTTNTQREHGTVAMPNDCQGTDVEVLIGNEADNKIKDKEGDDRTRALADFGESQQVGSSTQLQGRLSR